MSYSDWTTSATPLDDISAVLRMSRERYGFTQTTRVFMSRPTAMVVAGVYTVRRNRVKHRHRFGRQRLAELESKADPMPADAAEPMSFGWSETWRA